VLFHHPAGDGEYLQPIKPYQVSISQLRLPTIEEALFGHFFKRNRKGQLHKHLISLIFQEDLEKTREGLLPWIRHPRFDLQVLRQLAKKNIMEFQTYLDNDNVSVTLDQFENPPPWFPVHYKLYQTPEYSYWITVWIRVNCAHAIAEYLKIYYEVNQPEKFNLFINNHLDCIRLLDSLEDPRDINLKDLNYKPLGKSHFDNDRNFIEVDHYERKQLRPYPLEVIRQHFPQFPWTPEEVHLSERDVKEIRKDASYYMECLYLMRQMKHCYQDSDDKEVQDCLWFYHACFLDYLCGDDPVLSFKNYPHDNRSFTAWDLPDAFHVLIGIPFWGKQVELMFPVGKFIQKSLPFAGARRQLINRTDGSLNKDDAFWKVFSKLFYCMLLDMYPHFLSQGERSFDLKKLSHLKRISEDKKFLKKSLSIIATAKEKDKGCYIVFTAYRLWILLMSHEQMHFRNHSIINWELFHQKTIEMANTIRNSNLFVEDCFADAREILSKVNKNPKTKVYRFRKSNTIEMILEKMVQTLEKELYKEEDFSEVVLNQINHPIMDSSSDNGVKTKILNLLIRVPKEEWLTPLCLSMMRVYGKVSEHTIYLVQKMIDVYYDNAKPKDFDEIISLFEVDDFKVVCWYLQVINLLNKLDFDLITKQQVKQIDNAQKYVLLPGESLPDCAHDVFVTICCQVIKTLMNSYDYYGHENIAYDLDRQQFICSKAHKKASITYDDEEALALSDFEKQRKRMRDKRKDFNHIPCVNNPVLCIPMRGYVLIYNKTTRYMHCPSCGSFHQFVWSGWKGDSYACPQCRFRQKDYYYTCHTCMLEIPEEVAKQCNAEVEELDGEIRDVFRRVYFCRKHLPKRPEERGCFGDKK
jgi:hypothetical protein